MGRRLSLPRRFSSSFLRVFLLRDTRLRDKVTLRQSRRRNESTTSTRSKDRFKFLISVRLVRVCLTNVFPNGEFCRKDRRLTESAPNNVRVSGNEAKTYGCPLFKVELMVRGLLPRVKDHGRLRLSDEDELVAATDC